MTVITTSITIKNPCSLHQYTETASLLILFCTSFTLQFSVNLYVTHKFCGHQIQYYAPHCSSLL